MERTVLHCDLNNFFASVAALDNPSIKNCPIAVCGSVEDRHGIVLAKNYVAKSYGIKTAETVWQAKNKCPDLVIVPPTYKRYEELSLAVREIYSRYSDCIEPFGIDECWLDVTGSRLLFGTGEEIADKIRKRVKAETGLTISVGVSFNKVFAKLGSDLKKPDAVTVISRENYKDVAWPLPADAMLGVGGSTLKQLRSLGIVTIGDIVSAGEDVLKRRLKKAGELLFRFADGSDNSPVVSSVPPPKSVGRSTTCKTDLFNKKDTWPVVLSLAEEVSASLRLHGLFATTVQAYVRSTDLLKRVFQMNVTPTQSAVDIAKTAIKLIEENFGFTEPMRSVGVRASELSESNIYQPDLFSFNQNKEDKNIELKIYEIRNKFGKNSIVRGSVVNTKLKRK